MPISAEQLKQLLQQQQAQMEAQTKLIECLTQRLNLQVRDPSPAANNTTSIESIASSIKEFVYEPERGQTFEAWFRRWEDTFRIEFASQDDAWKVRLLVRKLGANEHVRYADSLLPKHPRDFTFNQTVEQLSDMFGEQTSLFNIRYQCLKLVKGDDDDFGSFSTTVNRECERFKLRTLTDDQFKCLIFVKGLQSPKDADIRTRLLALLEQNPELTLKALTSECQRLLNLKHDTAMVERSGSPISADHVHAVQKPNTPQSKNKKPPSPCWQCGDNHYSRFCPFKNHICQRCNKKGHKEERCWSQQAGSKNHHPKFSHRRRQKRQPKSNLVHASFKADFENRRRYVTLLINGAPVRMQLDTASDITLISRRTWELIGRPKIKKTTHTALNVSGGTLKLTGTVMCPVSMNDMKFRAVAYLTERPSLNILGLDWIDKLGLMKVPLNSVCNRIARSSSALTRSLPLRRSLAEHQKPKGKGTTQEITDKFLPAYRATPNACVPTDSSPTDAHLSRKVRLSADAIRPAKRSTKRRKKCMEALFNRKHRVDRHSFLPGQAVLARDCRQLYEDQTQGGGVRRR